MHVFRGTPHPLLKRPSAVAIGNFDGVHTGHRALLESVVQAANDRGLVPSVVTFEPHPKELVGNARVERLSTLRDKVEAILSAGIERIYLLPFNKRLASLRAEDFVRDVLVKGIDTCWLTVGEDFCFGSDRAGNVALLEAMGRELRFETVVAPTLFHTNARVSSSRIREALAHGDLYEASLMLGRRYSMTGRVIHGAELGRTIGVPTLNMAPIPPGSRAEPALKGVYAVTIDGLGPATQKGVASIGVKPTVTSERRWLLETHVFDWQGDAYGRVVRINFIEKLRDEKKFSGLDELKAAIAEDARRARLVLGCAPSPEAGADSGML